VSAAEALQAAAIAALGAIEELGGVYDGPPLQAAAPYAVVEAGPATDWGHKSGAGRELRLALVIRDEGESPARLRRLMAAAEAAALALGPELPGWRIVSLALVRAMATRERGERWVGLIELRARLLAL
jgi:hypothetical protein